MTSGIRRQVTTKLQLAAPLLWLVANACYAYEFDYSGERDASLLDCDRMLWTAQSTAAEICFRNLLQGTTDPYLQAESQWALGNLKAANDAFALAVVQQPDNPKVRVRWGYLYLQTWQYSDAVGLFQEALNIQPDYQPARIGIARASTAEFSAGGFEGLYDILEDNLDSIEAMMMMGRLLLEQRDIEGALVYLDTAAGLLNDDVPPTRLYAYYAVAEYLAGRDPQSYIDQALAINPGYGDLYVHLAFFAEVTYQYLDAVRFLQQGVRIDPYNWVARAELGLALAKIDDIDTARQHLEAAYQGDPYNSETTNLLKLFDTFDEFVVIERAVSYETASGPESTQVRLRLHRDEAAVMAPYVLELLEAAFPVYVERYQFKPQLPVTIELYPRHDDFAVRTLGEPMIGPLGITFGYLFAMDSPSAKGPGDFHWGSVFWHELSHVFSLEASGSRVPRWFSEGLSTFEEWNSGPLNHYQVPAYVFKAISEGRMLSVRELDSGFMRQSYENQIIVSYQQAGLICQFIAERWGDESFAKMLTAFKNRSDIEQVFEQVLGINTFAFDRQFGAWVDQEFSDVLGKIDAFMGYQGNAYSSLSMKDWQGVLDNARNALNIYPDYTEPDSAYEPLAIAHRELGDTETELLILQNYVGRGGYAPGAMRRLAELLDLQGDTTDALEVRRKLRFVAPFDEQLHRDLAVGYESIGDHESAIVELTMLLDLQVQDTASVHLGIARQHFALGRFELARRHTLLALETAPYYREAQNLLLDIMKQDL